MPAKPADSNSAPAADSQTLLADTSASVAKGTYFHTHGAGLAGVPVFVVKRYKATFHDKDGNPYQEEVGDLARFEGLDPFVTRCPVRDKPEDGYWVPA